MDGAPNSKTSNLAIIILVVAVSLALIIVSIALLLATVTTNDRGHQSVTFTTETLCKTRTYNVWRVLQPGDLHFLWVSNLTQIEAGTVHFVIRADVSSNVPVTLAIFSFDKEQEVNLIWSIPPSTRIVGIYTVDLDAGGYYVAAIVNPSRAAASVTVNIDVTACAKIPVPVWS